MTRAFLSLLTLSAGPGRNWTTTGGPEEQAPESNLSPSQRTTAAEIEAPAPRRLTVRNSWSRTADAAGDSVLALALSGGEIRSATYSLDVNQPLAGADQLKKIENSRQQARAGARE
jgi:hypothetical protein